jgi:hypothetical protein
MEARFELASSASGGRRWDGCQILPRESTGGLLNAQFSLTPSLRLGYWVAMSEA